MEKKDCPWCYQAKIGVSRTLKAARYECEKKCGYRVFMPKYMLTKGEIKQAFGKAKSLKS